jgi:hypothetical protein
MTTLQLSELHRALPQLADSHHKALSIAAKRQPPPNIRGAHSPGLTKLWSLPDPTPGIAERVRALVSQRRETGIVIDESDIAAATIDELRKAALVRASKSATKKERARVYRIASRLIRSYVLRRAKGHCEACTRALRFAVLTVHRILKRTIRSNWLTTDRITPRRLSGFAQTVTAGRISVRMQNPSMRRWYENCPNWSVPQRTPRLRFCDWLHVRSVRRMRLSQCSRPSAPLPDSLLRKRRSARMPPLIGVYFA